MQMEPSKAVLMGVMTELQMVELKEVLKDTRMEIQRVYSMMELPLDLW